ncbi:DUF5723 family protein [Dinghuibacter silviterrae]|uniref:DUF5723 domain-containing protein n=1 Tax=Dinghuibacter silviterrae TaxID=1539049 RepID=A0A4R8DI93_9BACT|nr:DUF5723 family protein [Dinghuibacter silviterrae]TDW97285.1 hypothetical protein EDB95_5132 [Dinghuibacter silviterrae]
MMKRCLLFMGFLYPFLTGAQTLPGFSTGNYTGVTGVFSNPANIADSRYRFDVCLFSLDPDVASDRVSFKLGTLGSSLKGDSLRNQLFGGGTGTVSALINVCIQGPSVMLRLPGKFSVALTTRARVVANVRDLDRSLANSLDNSQNGNANLPVTIQSPGNMAVNVNAWKEIGASVAREVMHKGPNFLKAGVTLRYLMGVGNGYMLVRNFSGTINEDNVLQQPYLSPTTGQIGMGFAGIDFSHVKGKDLTETHGTGVGADLGLVYEFRLPKGGYLLRAGASLLDLGSIGYTPEPQSSGVYNVHIGANQRYYLSDLDSVNLDNYKQHFAQNPLYFTPTDSGTAKYRVSLPTRVQLDLDYHVISFLYVNVMAQIRVASIQKAYNPTSYNTYTLTPRLEMRHLGVFVPISYNTLSGVNAGLALRAGPVFLGSGSILGAIFGQSKDANFFIGVHVGFLRH